MSYRAEILADSINPQGDRITTMKITFPRMMLAEFNTHRMFSRNSASSRAIPFKKMVKMVQENPFVPMAFQRDHKGMQGTEYISTKEGTYVCKRGWLEARDNAVKQANWLHSCNVTKQLCNRLLEPFMWHTVIVTSGKEGLNNFFKLRCPEYTIDLPVSNDRGEDWKTFKFKSKKDLKKEVYSDEIDNYNEIEWLQINQSQADIHVQAIAELMWDEFNSSTPKQLKAGEYHLPFGDNIDLSHSSFDKFKFENKALTDEELLNLKIKVSVAKCARISYETLGDNPKIDYEADIRLHNMLLKSGHFSPFEHVARAMSDEEYDSFFNGRLYVNQNVPNYKELNKKYAKNGKGWCRNFRGFIQYRYLIDNNN